MPIRLQKALASVHNASPTQPRVAHAGLWQVKTHFQPKANRPWISNELKSISAAALMISGPHKTELDYISIVSEGSGARECFCALDGLRHKS